jgi:hypothetical protein
MRNLPFLKGSVSPSSTYAVIKITLPLIRLFDLQISTCVRYPTLTRLGENLMSFLSRLRTGLTSGAYRR